MSTQRTEAFSDGVFAIAITLLILNIQPPHAGPGGLWHALLRLWPSYASYLVSFLTIGIIWVNHHAVFEHIARSDRTLLFLNLLLLMSVAFIPFPTALLADYLRHGGSDQHVAAAVFSGTFALLGTLFGVLWTYASHNRRLIRPDFSDAELVAMTRSFVAGSPLYAIAIAVAFLDAGACLALNGLLALFYALPWGGAMRLPAERRQDPS